MPDSKHPTPQSSGQTINLDLPPAQVLFLQMLAESVVIEDDWERLPPAIREEITSHSTPSKLFPKLTQYGLLTEYQVKRILAGTGSSLIMGNYRILEQIGAGGMGVVFKAEHMDLRRPVAIKTVSVSDHHDPKILRRFTAEIRAVAQLQHPNIVGAIDAGRCAAVDPLAPEIHYFVMEYVPGQDLERYVKSNGPLPLSQACDLIHQISSALSEAHEHKLVHRDIKPSNILMTPEGQAKLLDFGLALNADRRITIPGTMLGTMDYISPEQTIDAAQVDIRADIYGLGGVLYWCLTGKAPFPAKKHLLLAIADRQTQAPPSVCAVRPEIPVEMDALIVRMMARDPKDRFFTPRAVMQALVPFLKPEMHGRMEMRSKRNVDSADFSPPRLDPSNGRTHRLLIVDDNIQVRTFTKCALQSDDMQCDDAATGDEALRMVRATAYDLLLLDIDMPGMSGHQLCRHLRDDPPSPHLKIIMYSGRASPDEMAQIMNDGADDFITKPFSIIQLRARIKAALRLKSAQQRAETLNEHLLAVNADLEKNASSRDFDFSAARKVMILVLAELNALGHGDDEGRLIRLQRFCRCLAESVMRDSQRTSRLDDHFIELLECCVPIYDIGNATLPESLLKKPGKLTAEERYYMQTHTVAGADAMCRIARRHGLVGAFVQMSVDLIRHHHERYDGRGYPDQLCGESIPLAARILAIADVYDALRSHRTYKPALSHATTLEVLLKQSDGQFDPSMLRHFERCAAEFERIYRDSSTATT